MEVSINEIKDAFLRLKSAIYLDKNNLILRNKIAEYQTSPAFNDNLIALCNKINGKESFEENIKNINLNIFPKSLNIKKIHSIKNEYFDNSNFISNRFEDKSNEVENVTVFCDLDIELHIISILWILKFGCKIDSTLKKNCVGNRLDINEELEFSNNRALFKYYSNQYNKWIKGAVVTSQDLLEKDVNVSILNTDIQSYYQSIEFDFTSLYSIIPEVDFNESYIHQIFVDIHFSYIVKLNIYNNGSLEYPPTKFPLPIGLLSSPILANYYLINFDDLLSQDESIEYYSRYVDDIIIVKKEESNFEDIYDITSSNENRTIIEFYITKFLSKYFKLMSDNQICIFNLPNLKLKLEKTYLYQFDSKLSTNIIVKFLEEFKERSSEFKFMSDTEDDLSFEVERESFIGLFDEIEGNASKFKQGEVNKFKVSTYLTKLITRRIIKGENYGEDEFNKIEKFFQGVFLIHNYLYWEKLFTLYVAFNKSTEDLKNNIEEQINQIEFEKHSVLLKESLTKHLKFSLEMALQIDRDKSESNHFRKTFLLRKNYLQDSLQCFRHDFIEHGGFKCNNYDIHKSRINYVPFLVKFYEVSLYKYFSIFSNKLSSFPLDDSKILSFSFKLFAHINGVKECEIEKYKKHFFKINQSKSKYDKKINICEIELPQDTAKERPLIIALINLFVDINNIKGSKSSTYSLTAERKELYRSILDNVLKIKVKVDLFVQPELSLPYEMLMTYLTFSSRNQIGFVSGLEYKVENNKLLNFVLTCLPIKIDDVYHDCIPVFRLKNHYSPHESLHESLFTIPKLTKYTYNIFRWRRAYFTTYYCYELTNVIHRTLFLSKIDFLVAPIWNRDTYYYKNIVECTVRDLHCFFIQSNTSQYGDSRVSKPCKHDKMNKAIVKGGTMKGYEYNILLSEVNFDSLRNFQLLDDEYQEIDGRFKFTPPDFDIKNVWRRINEDTVIN